jgi:hypothetical protein
MAAVSAVAVSMEVAASAVIAKQAVFMGEKRGANRAPFFSWPIVRHPTDTRASSCYDLARYDPARIENTFEAVWTGRSGQTKLRARLWSASSAGGE